MKRTLKLLTLCTALNLWAPIDTNMARHLNSDVDEMVKNVGNNSQSRYREESLPLEAQSPEEWDSFANDVIKKKDWTPEDSEKMMNLIKPENEEFLKISSNYLQSKSGLLILCYEKEIARKITTVLTGIVGGVLIAVGSMLYSYCKEFINSKLTILGGDASNVSEMTDQVNVSFKGIWDWFVSFIKKPAEILFPLQLRIADNRTSFTSIDSLDSISFFKSYPKCKELYRKFANKVINGSFTKLMKMLHKDSHKAIAFSAQLAVRDQEEAIKINEENNKLKAKIESIRKQQEEEKKQAEEQERINQEKAKEQEQAKIVALEKQAAEKALQEKINQEKAKEQKEKEQAKIAVLEKQIFLQRAIMCVALGCVFVHFIVR